MIYININTPTSVAVTLNENANLSNPFYVWQLQDDTNLQYVFTGDDISMAPQNYNLFTFNVITGATFGLTQGIIPCPAGEYIYKVWETEVQYDLNLNNALDVVEKGIFNIIGTFSMVPTFDNTIIIPTFKTQ